MALDRMTCYQRRPVAERLAPPAVYQLEPRPISGTPRSTTRTWGLRCRDSDNLAATVADGASTRSAFIARFRHAGHDGFGLR